MAITKIPSSGTTDGTNMVLLSSQNITTAVSEVAFDNVMDSTYDIYKFEGYVETTHTSLVTFRSKVGYGSTPTYLTSANYGWNTTFRRTLPNNTHGGGTTGRGDDDSEFQIGTSDLRDAFAHFTLTLSNVNDANDGHHLAYWQYGHHDENENRIEGNNGQAMFNTDNALTSIKFYFNTGNINSGKISCYGVRT